MLVGELVDQGIGGRVAHAQTTQTGSNAECDQQVRLAGPGALRSRSDAGHVELGGDLGQLSAIRSRLEAG